MVSLFGAHDSLLRQPYSQQMGKSHLIYMLLGLIKSTLFWIGIPKNSFKKDRSPSKKG